LNNIPVVRRKILLWHTGNKRDFPWRHTKDPYKIIIAEFMLHRTKAEQVVPVYLDFIEKYPDVFALTNANFEDVKKVTKHLGLHWRAKHFLESANFVVEKYNGKFPADYQKLREVPGAGEYIAGAILTVCFNKSAPAVDSNIARFINRYYGLNLSGEIRRKKEIINIAGELFKYKHPGEFLFALVDFVALICKPRKPFCEKCPLINECKYDRAIDDNGQSPNSGHTATLCSAQMLGHVSHIVCPRPLYDV